MASFAAAILALANLAAAEQIQQGPAPGVLLLRNGEVLSGRVIQAGDQYRVVLPDGEIRVNSRQVDFCCRDLEEAYWRKRAAIELGSVKDHVDLAAWCQRQGLTGHAARELADAMAADPTHPMIGLLERRLKMSTEPVGSHKRPAAAVGPVASTEDLDRLIRGVPRPAVEMFTQTIQPMLVNGCTSAGCHGPQAETEFKLFRIRPGRAPSRRLTQRNLHSTLKLVDRADPLASKLLTVPIRPHGTAKAAIFTSCQTSQYRDLVNWVNRVSKAPEKRDPTSIQTSSPWAEMDRPATAGAKTTKVRSAGFDFPEPKPNPPEPREPNESTPGITEGIAPPVKKSTLKRGTPPRPFVPVDPFDPEIFNRRLPAEK